MKSNILISWLAICTSIIAVPVFGQQATNATPDSLQLSIESPKPTYFVSEPLQITLRVSNPTSHTLEFPQDHKTRYTLRIRDLDSKTNLVEPSAEASFLIYEEDAPKNIQLDATQSINSVLTGPGNGENSFCPKIGRYGVKYTYHSIGSPKQRWESNEIEIKCIEQPLSFPNGTPQNIRILIKQIEPSGIESSRPGWTNVNHNDTMKQLIQLGDASIPALLANMNNYQRQLPIFELMGELRVEAAVPELLAALEMRDNWRDSLIVAKLAEITKHEDGYHYHRRWFDPAVRKTAVNSYQKWWADRQSKRALKND